MEYLQSDHLLYLNTWTNMSRKQDSQGGFLLNKPGANKTCLAPSACSQFTNIK